MNDINKYADYVLVQENVKKTNNLCANDDKVNMAKLYKDAAEQGIPKAEFYYALCCLRGIGRKIDSIEGEKWLLKAVNKDLPEARYEYALQLMKVEPSIIDGFTILEDLAEENYSFAQFKMGQFYEKGVIVEENKDKYIRYYTAAAKNGCNEAKVYLANIYEYGRTLITKDFDKAIFWYKDLVDHGYKKYLHNIAGLCYKKNNIKEAIEWYKKGIENGLIEDCINLAEIYGDDQSLEAIELYEKYINSENEKNCDADIYAKLAARYKFIGNTKKTTEWYEKAVVNGKKEFITCVAEGYYSLGNINQALEWYKKAVLQGNRQWCERVAVLYEKLGSVDEAAYWYEKTAENGRMDLAYKVAGLYEKLGNQTKTACWYEKTAENGRMDLAYKVAGLYEKLGNQTKTVYWYEKAAENGKVELACKVAALYDRIHEYDKAIFWYKRAVKNNEIGIAQKIACLYIRTGKRKDAVKWYEIANEEGGIDFSNEIGYLYDELGVYNKAVEWYERGYEKGSTKYILNLCKCYERLGNYSAASRYYNRAISLGYTYVYDKLGLCYKNLELYEDAISCLEKAEKLENIDESEKIAFCYYKLGKYDEALKLYKGTYKQENGKTLYKIAECYEHLNKYSNALQLYKKLSNNNLLAKYKVGEFYEFGYGVSQNYSEALKMYKEAIPCNREFINQKVTNLERKIGNNIFVSIVDMLLCVAMFDALTFNDYEFFSAFFGIFILIPVWLVIYKIVFLILGSKVSVYLKNILSFVFVCIIGACGLFFTSILNVSAYSLTFIMSSIISFIVYNWKSTICASSWVMYLFTFVLVAIVYLLYF